MKKLGILSIIITVCVMFSSCGASYAQTESMDMDNAKVEAEKFFLYSSTADDALLDSGAISYGRGGEVGATAHMPGESASIQEEKLVYTSNVTLETEDFDKASTDLHAAIKSLGGIIISENAQNLNNINSQGFRTLYISVRIPQENYDAFLSGLSESYNVASLQNHVDNLTEYYYDNENRLRSYRIQEERLFAMLEKAENVSEMLEIESRLCDVQYEIESLTNTQKTIDNDVKYATFHLNLHEVTKFTSPAPKTFGDRFSETVKNSGEAFAEFLEGTLFVLIFLAPYLVIFAIALVIGIIIVKNKKKKAKAKDAENEK